MSVRWDNGTTEDCIFTGDEGEYLLVLSTSSMIEEREGKAVVQGPSAEGEAEFSPRTILCRNPKALIQSLRKQHGAATSADVQVAGDTAAGGAANTNTTVGIILDKTRIAFIVPGSAASKPREGGALMKGDEILAVDGVAVTDDDVVRRLRGADVGESGSGLGVASALRAAIAP